MYAYKHNFDEKQKQAYLNMSFAIMTNTCTSTFVLKFINTVLNMAMFLKILEQVSLLKKQQK